MTRGLGCSHGGWAIVSCLVCVVAAAGFLAPLPSSGEEDEPGTGTDKPPAKPESPIASYLKALRSVKEEHISGDGIEIDIRVVADQYLVEMAVAYEDGKRSGLATDELTKKLRVVHGKHKGDKNRPLFHVLVTPTNKQCHLWVEDDLKSHVSIARASLTNVKILDKKGFQKSKWWFKETSTGKDVRRDLNYFREGSFVLEPSGAMEGKAKEPMTIKFKGILRYREAEKKNLYDRMGINVEARQLQVAELSSLVPPELTATVYPAEWKLPAPPGELGVLLIEMDTK